VTPCPNTKHQVVCGNLYWLLRSYLQEQRIGRLFFAPFDVVFSAFDVVEPDLLYMSHERALEILTEANVQGVPELVVEIASKSTRKRDESAAGFGPDLEQDQNDERVLDEVVVQSRQELAPEQRCEAARGHQRLEHGRNREFCFEPERRT